MAAEGACVACGDTVAGWDCIPCYLCGAFFHFSRDRTCGITKPQYPCCGLTYVCAICARRELGIAVTVSRP